MQFSQLKHFSSLRLSQFSKIVPIKMAYLRYAVCGCCLCIKNANCYILGEDVKWRGGCARRRGADFILLVKWLCAPRGPEAELVFSLSWFSRWSRGGCFSFGQMACAPRGPERRASFFFEQVRALVARGEFYFRVKWLCAPRGPEVGRGVSNPPSLPLDSTLPATS